MAVLFVSHASKDDRVVAALEAWLRGRGFIDIFIDHSAIAGGESWRQALQASAGTCRVVLCVVTEAWLASDQCMAEFDASFYMGKRVIPLFLLAADAELEPKQKQRLASVRAHYQGLDIAACLGASGLDLDAHPEISESLTASLRAGGALSRVGLDPRAFAIDRALRPMPFPGLTSFGDEDADAALFYGRSREIEQALEQLRGMRAKQDRRPFAILGASGAGKSSLLKAGILPRLRREAPAWLPLRAFRPGADPLANFAEALSRTLGDLGRHEAHGPIRDRLAAAWSRAERADGALTETGRATLREALDAHASALRQAAGRPGASLLISIDQAEEIAQPGAVGGDRLADYLRAAIEAETGWHVALTIRTDSFQELQGHPAFQGLQAHPFDLRAMPVFRFDSIIEEPAKCYDVAVEHALVDALMAHAPKDDALPLLAFALQRLWREYAASGSLVLENYEAGGGLRGLIAHAAERALMGISPEEDRPLPAPPKARLDLAASTFVPALAQVNDLGAVIRRIAPWAAFTEEQRELLDAFDRWRLVVRKMDVDGGTVEVAHEALFREWDRFALWLEPERARLETLRTLQLDAASWERGGRDPDYLNHREKRFKEADALRNHALYGERLLPADHDYLEACRVAERLARGRKRRMQAALATLVIAVFSVFLFYRNEEAVRAEYDWVFKIEPYRRAKVRPFVPPDTEVAALHETARFRDCPGDCPWLVVIPSGTFLMGTKAEDPSPYANERPQHQVQLDHRYAIGQYDVTVAQYAACVATGGCPRSDYTNNRNDGDLPATNLPATDVPATDVTWDDARAYATWLSVVTGKTYRLPTEAEWERAARGGTTTTYYWGDTVGVNHANCNGCGSRWDNRSTSPVDAFGANPYGVYDMAGNVWQWVLDCAPDHDDGNYKRAHVDGSASRRLDCQRHYGRGGSYVRLPINIRPAARYPMATDEHSIYQGFRVVREIAP